jgi:hypothetical protein
VAAIAFGLHRRDLVPQVGPVDPGVEDVRIAQAQLPDDVVGDFGRRGRGQGEDGGVAELFDGIRELEIRGPEIVAPLGDAVRFVNDDQVNLDPFQGADEPRVGEPLGGRQQKLRRRARQGRQRVGSFAGRQGAIELRRPHPQLVQLVDLVLHERDQGRHHDGHSGQVQGGQLVAQRLARAGRHDRKCVATVHNGVDHGLLPRTKRFQVEHFLQRVFERLHPWSTSGLLCGRHVP